MSITRNDLKELQDIFEKEETITQTAKVFCKRKGITYTDSLRRRASKILNESANFDTETSTVTNQYADDLEKLKKKDEEEVIVANMPSAWDSDLNRFLSIDEYCDKFGLPKEQVRSSKLVSHVSQHMVYNIAFNPTISEQTGIDEVFIEEVVKKFIKPTKIVSVEKRSEEWFDRLVYSDVHIALNPNASEGDPLYDGKWDREEIFKRLDIMVQETISNRKGSVLYIDELGDFLDGLFGKTTRKGHDLPQNMNDKEAFETGIEFKVKLIEDLLPYYVKIVCNSVTNDNHAGVFGYFLNTAVKGIVESKFPEKVEYNLIKRFIEHYTVGKHTFINSHGKDHLENKTGNKPVLDSKTYQKIDQYCKEHNLYNGNLIEYSFGDCHQQIHDYTTSNEFEYRSYPAFSPPSNWVKLNFKLTKSGFNNYNVDKTSNKKIIIPYFFDKQ